MSENTGDTDSNSISDEHLSTDTPVVKSVVARLSGWRTGVLAVSIACLVVAFVIDVDSVIRYGIALVVFVLWMWWFLTSSAAEWLGE